MKKELVDVKKAKLTISPMCIDTDKYFYVGKDISEIDKCKLNKGKHSILINRTNSKIEFYGQMYKDYRHRFTKEYYTDRGRKIGSKDRSVKFIGYLSKDWKNCGRSYRDNGKIAEVYCSRNGYKRYGAIVEYASDGSIGKINIIMSVFR